MFLGASPNKYVQSENQKFLTYMYRYYAIPRQKNIVSIVRTTFVFSKSVKRHVMNQ